jgi:hypothetical protein
MIDISTVISVITGVLLAISEALPFIKSLESQGILHFLINIGQKLNQPELQPLLNDIEQQGQQDQQQGQQTSEFQQTGEIRILIDSMNSTINNVACNINTVSTNVNYISQILKDISNDFKTARQLKLQTSELYQLNYIINYIKQNYIKRQLKFKNLSKNNKELLSSEGYIINYDSQEDTSVISW